MLHRHQYVAVAKRHLADREKDVTGAVVLANTSTRILKRCQCGATTVEMIDGMWEDRDLGIMPGALDVDARAAYNQGYSDAMADKGMRS